MHKSIRLLSALTATTFAVAGTVALVSPQIAATSETVGASTESVIEIGQDLEIMASTPIISSLGGSAELRTNAPERREVVATTDRPWEGNANHFRNVFEYDGEYRMYYSAAHNGSENRPAQGFGMALMTSTDGITWTRPDLGLVTFQGSTDNNLIAGITSAETFIFYDTRPGVPADEQFKAVEPAGTSIYIRKSADGLSFQPYHAAPIMTWGASSPQGFVNQAFDSLNTLFWDAENDEYRLYFRYHDDKPGGGGTFRSIYTSTSTDLITWSTPVRLSYPGAHDEFTQLYTNGITPYYRSPGTLVGFPMRYIEPSTWLESHYYLPGIKDRLGRVANDLRYGTVVTDALFMSSRDRTSFFRDDTAYIRPTTGTNNWVYADQSIGSGIVETPSAIEGAPNELSMYVVEGYWTGDDMDLVRYSTRIDGFASVYAPIQGGEMVTKPLSFSGDQLVLNVATAAAGRVRVELLDAAGAPLAGYGLADADPIFGNDLARAVSWQGSSDLSALEGQSVRIRMVMQDADIYSLQFREVPTFSGLDAIVSDFQAEGDIPSSVSSALRASLSAAGSAYEEGDWAASVEEMTGFLEDVDAAQIPPRVATVLRIQTDSLQARSWKQAIELPTRSGFLANDTDPRIGNLTNFSDSAGLFALDYRARSVGIGFWEPTRVRGLILNDNNTATRITPDDLRVWVSDTNDSDWTEIEGVHVARTVRGFEFSGFDVTARFIKVSQPYTDTAHTVAYARNAMLQPVYDDMPPRFAVLTGDADPETSTTLNFGLSPTTVAALDYRHRSIAADLWQQQRVTGLVLTDSDTQTRIVPGDLRVYVSDTNDGDWVEVPDLDIVRTSNGFRISGIDVMTRFVKVWHSYGDDAWTFANPIGTLLQVETSAGVPEPDHPAVQGDVAAVVQGESILIDVLANDVQTTGMPALDVATLTLLDGTDVVSTVTSPGQGTFSIEDGQVRFAADATFAGIATATYRVSDTDGASATATIAVTVTASAPASKVNNAPAERRGPAVIDGLENGGGAEPDHQPAPLLPIAGTDPTATVPSPADPSVTGGGGSLLLFGALGGSVVVLGVLAWLVIARLRSVADAAP